MHGGLDDVLPAPHAPVLQVDRQSCDKAGVARQREFRCPLTLVVQAKALFCKLLCLGRRAHLTASYAAEHGEMERYRTSNRVNFQCKEAIEAAVREHFDGMYLNQDAAKGVIQTYGLDRVMLVLANTVQLQDWDGRYSHRNKEWAKTIPNYNSDTVRRGYALNSHPAVLDGFIDLVSEEQQRSHTKGEKAQQPRTSVRDKLKQEPPAHKPVTQKKREQER